MYTLHYELKIPCVCVCVCMWIVEECETHYVIPHSHSVGFKQLSYGIWRRYIFSYSTWLIISIVSSESIKSSLRIRCKWFLMHIHSFKLSFSSHCIIMFELFQFDMHLTIQCVCVYVCSIDLVCRSLDLRQFDCTFKMIELLIASFWVRCTHIA